MNKLLNLICWSEVVIGLAWLHSAQLGSAWLSTAIESILALKFRRSPFCSNNFEFSIYYSSGQQKYSYHININVQVHQIVFRDKLKTRPYKHKGATCGLQERRRFFHKEKISRPGKRLVAIKIQSRFGTHFSFCRPGSFSDGLKKDIYIERERTEVG